LQVSALPILPHDAERVAQLAIIFRLSPRLARTVRGEFFGLYLRTLKLVRRRSYSIACINIAAASTA
jgi:hypothetical protein